MFAKKKNKSEKKLCLINKKASFAYVEAYKSLRTNIEYIASTNNYHSIIVTSPAPGEGKSTVSINLAETMGNSGKKVILVDCDLRKASITSYLKLSRKNQGISGVLSGKCSLDDAIIRSSNVSFDILPCGVIPANPAEIIGSEAMVDIIDALSESYDYVFIDTPPITVVTDAAIISRYTDGVMLVARSDKTLKPALAQSKQRLEDVNARILGVVLNDYNKKNHSYGGNYDYSYSYSAEDD